MGESKGRRGELITQHERQSRLLAHSSHLHQAVTMAPEFSGAIRIMASDHAGPRKQSDVMFVDTIGATPPKLG